MKRTLTFTSAIVVAALSLPVLPAAAQQHRGGGNQGGGGGRVAPAPRSAAPQGSPSQPRGSASGPTYRGAPSGRSYSAPQAQPRTSGPRTYGSPQAQPSGPRTYGSPQAQPRTSGPRTYGSPQALPGSSGARTYGSPQAVPGTGGTYRGGTQAVPGSSGARTYGSPQAVPGTGGTYRGGSQAVPRTGGTYSGGTYRGGTQAVPRTDGDGRYGIHNDYAGGFRGGYHPTMIRPYFSETYVRPYGWRPYYPYHFVRPYYVFSPWLSLGFGIWCGYPVPYPWVYLGDYQPTVFGYYSDVQPLPVAPSYGGVSFDIQPADANLFVDGQYVGVVGTFGPSNEPLTLEPGTHRIAIQREGFRPLEWDVTIEAGQVIPYRGVLDRQ